jgi:hypothetical protein
MFTNKAGAVVKGVLVVFGLGLVVMILQSTMDQARQTSCNYSSPDVTRCLAPSVANFGLSSDGPERKIDGPSDTSSVSK